MKTNTKDLKTMSGHGFTQFELTQKLLNNLSQFEITPTAKLVLMYLSSCYNPKRVDMFPKQKTIAAKIGVSERSVVRAISELISAGLIIVECKNTNRYKFTSKIVGKCLEQEKIFTSDNLSDDGCQNVGSKRDKLSRHEHEQTKEHKKEPIGVEDFKILKQYALENGAKNVKAFIAWMKKSGKAQEVLNEHKMLSRRYCTGELERLKDINSRECEQVSQDYFEKVRKGFGI